MQILRDKDIWDLLSFEDVFDVSERVFRSVAEHTIHVAHGGTIWMDKGHHNMFCSMSAYLPEQKIAGMKWFNMFVDHLPDVPSMNGHLIVLNDTETGAPIALCNGTAITAMRTAPGHGTVAAVHLSKPDSSVLAVIGCGKQGWLGIQAICRKFPISEIRLYSKSQERMEELRSLMKKQFLPNVTICHSPPEAAWNADIILSVTDSQRPLLSEKDIAPGATVLGLYSFNDLDQNMASDLDKWVVGCRASDQKSILENQALKARGVTLCSEWIYAELGDIICHRKPGRENDKERILYTHMGMAAFDVAVAAALYKKATQRPQPGEFLTF